MRERIEMNGLRIPIMLNATWTLDDGDWTWMELEMGEKRKIIRTAAM